MNGFIFVNAAGLGVGLAMDAFSLSVANALNVPTLTRTKRVLISASYALFQFLMPLAGWFVVCNFVERFNAFRPFIPWIAFVLLFYIGGKMIAGALRGEGDPARAVTALTLPVILMQDIATSIDALSVGFTIADYSFPEAFLCSLVIAAVTFVITLSGFLLGKNLAGSLGKKAPLLGGGILIAIGFEILLKGLFF